MTTPQDIIDDVKETYKIVAGVTNLVIGQYQLNFYETFAQLREQRAIRRDSPFGRVISYEFTYEHSKPITKATIIVDNITILDAGNKIFQGQELFTHTDNGR